MSSLDSIQYSEYTNRVKVAKSYLFLLTVRSQPKCISANTVNHKGNSVVLYTCTVYIHKGNECVSTANSQLLCFSVNGQFKTVKFQCQRQTHNGNVSVSNLSNFSVRCQRT